MPVDFKIFLVMGAMLTLQSLTALLEGYKFLSYARRSWARQPGNYKPRVALIIPVKGWEPDYEQNALAFLRQDFPDYQVIFSLATMEDAACAQLRQIAGRCDSKPGADPGELLIIAGPPSDQRGEKIQNLINALGAVRPGTEVLVFADIDGFPHHDWLRSLVGPLADPKVTVSSGFRWYLPGETFGSRLRAAWDTSIATMLRERGDNFAWGGSMAIRTQDFERLRIADRYWLDTVSDDYGVRSAVRAAGGWIRFEPRCLLASREESSVGAFLRWSNRQIILTRVYAAKLWGMGMAANLLYCGTFALGLLLIATPHSSARERLIIAVLLAAILALGESKARLRLLVARERFQEAAETLRRNGSCYWTLAPLVPWVMLYNFVTAGLTRRIEWRGVRYRLQPGKVTIERN